MRIGVMLRHYDQHEGGVKVYTRSILPHMFSMSPSNEYVVLYQNRSLVGSFSKYNNVEEVALAIPGKIVWDQVVVPWFAKKRKLDVIFNPKLTIPLVSSVKRVVVLHGSEKFVIPWAFVWYDRLYFKRFIPLYCSVADAIITVSSRVREDVVRFTGTNPAKVFAIHNGFDSEAFRIIQDSQWLKQVREKYLLPDRFVLWAGQIDPRKNVGRVFQAFAQIKDRIPHHLVIAGEERHRAKGDLKQIESLGIQDRLHFTGWVPHEHLPVLYNLSELFLFPSLYEGFGIPLLEAMACGCPVVTSKTATPPEVVDGAGYLVNPLDVGEIADAIHEVLSNVVLRKGMIDKGLARVKSFGWDKCAKEVLGVIEALGD